MIMSMVWVIWAGFSLGHVDVFRRKCSDREPSVRRCLSDASISPDRPLPSGTFGELLAYSGSLFSISLPAEIRIPSEHGGVEPELRGLDPDPPCHRFIFQLSPVYLLAWFS
jgi:hypothetical protein